MSLLPLRKTHAMALLSLFAIAALPARTSAQPSTRFTVGGRDIVKVDFANSPLGDFPSNLEMVDGIMDVVSKNGRNMLRASSRSVFRIQLPQLLPQDFSLEFDIIPKQGGMPEDLAIEGTPLINQGGNSANVLWHRDYLQIVGGGASYDSRVPPSFAATLPGMLTQVVLAMQGETMKLYTNGRLMFMQSNRKFVRGRVLRVFLGGQDDGPNAVYLASFRVVAGGPPVGPIAADGAPAGSNPTGASAAVPGPSALPQSANPLPNVGGAGPGTGTVASGSGGTGGPAAAIVNNVSVTLGPNGPIVDWQGGSAPAIYTVQRWKTDDPQCCNNTSAANPPLTGPKWQDSPPPISGTYTYRVTATTSSGSAMAGTNFDYIRGTSSGTVIAGGQTSGPRSVGTSTTPTLTSPPAAGAGVPVASGFTVTVTMGPNGPIVTWPPVPQASGYRASRTKFDDANCCNTSFGTRTFGATSPWQDQPLPVSGTYTYQVVANTPNGQMLAETQFVFRQPGGAPAPATTTVTAVPIPAPSGTITPITAPVAAVPVAPTSGTITPLPAPNAGTVTPPPGTRSGSPTAMNTAAAPANLRVNLAASTPLRAWLTWEGVVGATEYRVSRSTTGGTWSSVGVVAPSIAVGGVLLDRDYIDVLTDYQVTYKYQVQAYQADGTFGAASVDFTPPIPEVTSFTATSTGGSVQFAWMFTGDGRRTFRIHGPGTGTGIDVPGQTHLGSGPKSFTLSDVPAGTHTWSIATAWVPDGVLTPSSAWPTATTTVDYSGNYQISIESVVAKSDAVDDLLNLDGIGNEFYVSARVSTLNARAERLSKADFRSATHGDISRWPPPARVKSGTKSASGGVIAGDVISPIWAQPDAASTGLSRLVLWQGKLTEEIHEVEVVPVIWESDNDDVFYQRFGAQLDRSGSTVLDLNARTATGDISNVMALGMSGPWVFNLLTPGDRPIGVARPKQDPLDDTAHWGPSAIRVTHAVAEAALAGAFGPAGLIPIRFVDHLEGSRSTFTHPDLGMGDYVLNIRITRVP